MGKDEIDIKAYWKRIKDLFVSEQVTMMDKDARTGGDARRKEKKQGRRY